MTDGVLLAEIGHDRDLRRYDTIIIDEAHERSLNIDFLLGYLKLLLPGGRTSRSSSPRPRSTPTGSPPTSPTPTAPARRSSRCPGRTYPVEIRYRPMLADGEADQVGGICAAITELSALGDGDILVFCSGEREIRDAAEAITAMDLRRTEVLPLYARLSAAEQHRVFSAHTGRRIVLATNVAETSLTVPGIRYVIDPGTARMSRYSARTKVQRLPIEPISQASANQRAGRCGRVAPGVCIRLYDEEDFAEPARVHRAGDPAHQPGVGDLADGGRRPRRDRHLPLRRGARLQPDQRRPPAAERARRAVVRPRASGPRLTRIGRRLAQIPVDPRMGRMLLAGERLGCLAEILVIVAGLSIQDPRERPAEHRDKAEALHRRFWAPLPEPTRPRRTVDRDARGDPTARTAATSWRCLRLWDYLRSQQKALSGNAFRRMCRQEYLHFLRIREWQDLHAQLRDIARDLKLERNSAAAPIERVHTADPDRSAVPGRTGRPQGGASRVRAPARRGARRCGSTSAPAAPGSRSTRARRWPGPSRRW